MKPNHIILLTFLLFQFAFNTTKAQVLDLSPLLIKTARWKIERKHEYHYHEKYFTFKIRDSLHIETDQNDSYYSHWGVLRPSTKFSIEIEYQDGKVYYDYLSSSGKTMIFKQNMGNLLRNPKKPTTSVDNDNYANEILLLTQTTK